MNQLANIKFHNFISEIFTLIEKLTFINDFPDLSMDDLTRLTFSDLNLVKSHDSELLNINFNTKTKMKYVMLLTKLNFIGFFEACFILGNILWMFYVVPSTDYVKTTIWPNMLVSLYITIAILLTVIIHHIYLRLRKVKYKKHE